MGLQESCRVTIVARLACPEGESWGGGARGGGGGERSPAGPDHRRLIGLQLGVPPQKSNPDVIAVRGRLGADEAVVLFDVCFQRGGKFGSGSGI